MSNQANVPKINRAARLSILSALYASGVVGVLHWLNREYDIISDPLSYYAVGALGAWMTSAIAAFALSVMALAHALSRVLDVSRVGIALLWNAGASFFIASIFPTDVTASSLPVTIVGFIHTIASYYAAPCLVSAALLLSRRGEMLYGFALASWFALVVLVIVNHLQLHVGGIGQRIFLALVWLWTMLSARRVQRLRLRGDASAQ